jgi:Zn-dependent M16 (insulinase) family peptidase
MELKLNEKYHGFALKKIQDLKDCEGTLYEFEHQKTGAQLVWLDRRDANKTFAITFKTIPSDDTGVFHILEHSVLNGSKKYPVKEPFVQLLKSSMQTFLNAFTAPDKTMYPVSSRNDKDFMNLMSVYMDAVFHPAIYTNPNIFYQEGWHYEIRDEKEAPVYKGVVLNEMKGAFSSVDETMIDELNRMLFKDNCYQYVSGGDPEHITDLTYKKFIETHQKFYHPSNARVWLDGDLDIDACLAFINDEYFAKYQKEDKNFSIPMQTAEKAAVRKCEYEIEEEDQIKDRTQISIAKIVASYDEAEKNIAWSALDDVVVANNESLLKKNIIDAGLGEDVELGVYNGIQQPWAVLTIRNTNEDQYEALRKVIHDTAEALVKDGLNHDEIIATLNQMEFKYREKHEPAGLMYAERAMNSWLYEGDPALYLQEGQIFEQLRQKVKDGYFEELLKDFLLDEDHLQTVIAVPSKKAGAERIKRENTKLQEAKKSWGTHVSEHVSLNENLDNWQAAEDIPEALDTLPKLSLNDIQKEPMPFPYEEKEISGVPVLIHPQEDGIVYLNLYFNLAGVTRDHLASLGFWSTLMTNLRTKEHTLSQLQENMKRDLGDLGIYLEAYSQRNEADSCYPIIGVSISALQQNIHKAVPILKEILFDTLYEKEPILSLLKQDNESFRQELINAGHGDAMRRASAHQSAEGVFREFVGGYESGLYEKELEDAYDEKFETFQQECEMYADIIFSKARVTVSVSGNENIDTVKEVISMLHDYDANKAKMHYPLLAEDRQSLMIPAGIAYGAINTNITRYSYGYEPCMKVMAHILTYDWLWNEVRVKGGAYGTGFAVNENGSIGIYSYRDPDPMNLYHAAMDAADYLIQLADSDLDLDQMIIGTIASGEPLLSPAMKVRVGDAMYFSHVDYAMRAKGRKELLAMNNKQLKEYGKMLKEVLAGSSICIIGSKEKIEGCEELKLKPLQQL